MKQRGKTMTVYGLFKKPSARLAMIAIVLLACSFGPLTAIGGKKGINKQVELTVGKASTIELSSQVADVLVANPAIADVGTLRADRLFIVGKTVGATNVLAFDASGNQLADINVQVKVDQSALADTINEFFPEEDITVRTVNNNIVLSGTVSTPLVANRVRDLAGRFVTTQGQTIVDLMGVKGEQQVMLKVKVVEVRRSVLREYGIETDYKLGNTDGGILSTDALTGQVATSPFGTGQILFDDDGGFGPLRLGLAALEREGLVNVLAEPNLTAISGETAGFLAGGEFPIPTGTSDNGNTITIEFKQFGVALNFRPTVLSRENISLQLSTEVSSVAADDIVSLSGVDIPGLSVRRAETTVELASGGTIMIAGLIQSGTVDGLNGLPGIKDVPILGDLMKSKSFQRDESELIILVTPYLVKPFAKAEATYQGGPDAPPPLPKMGALPLPSPEAADAALTERAAADMPVDAYEPVAPVMAPEPVVADALPAPKAAPAKTPSVKMAAAAKPAEVASGGKISPLSKKFITNLQGVYGNRLKPPVDAGGQFGYLVD